LTITCHYICACYPNPNPNQSFPLHLNAVYSAEKQNLFTVLRCLPCKLYGTKATVNSRILIILCCTLFDREIDETNSSKATVNAKILIFLCCTLFDRAIH
jgi:hypothetical protein